MYLKDDEGKSLGDYFEIPECNTAENISKARKAVNYLLVPFNGEQLPEDVKELLYQKSKEEIEHNTNCGVLPDEMIGERQYYIEFHVHDDRILNTNIGVDLIVKDKYWEVRNSEKYARYIAQCRPQHEIDRKNLSLMCIAYPVFKLECDLEDIFERLFIFPEFKEDFKEELLNILDSDEFEDFSFSKDEIEEAFNSDNFEDYEIYDIENIMSKLSRDGWHNFFSEYYEGAFWKFVVEKFYEVNPVINDYGNVFACVIENSLFGGRLADLTEDWLNKIDICDWKKKFLSKCTVNGEMRK